MSIAEKVEDWVRKMGYDGAIPHSLPKICNPSTAFIWEQLITNVRPRQDVEHIRKNIIVNRLSRRPLEEQDQFSYPIKEIEVYVQKQKKEKKIESLERNIAEKETEVEELLKRNKRTYVSIDSVKARVKENREKKYLLVQKAKLLQEDIQRAQEALTSARNLTPVEMDEQSDGDEITKTLQKCAEKLEKLSERVIFPETKTNRSLSASLMKPISKSPKFASEINKFSRYLDHSTTLTELAPTAEKRIDANKENVDFWSVSRNLKFSNEENQKSKPKRESLGLLPDDCFNTSEDLDAFLLSDSSILQPLNETFLQPIKKSEFALFEALQKDVDVETLKNLLHKNNRYQIMSKSKSVYEKLLVDVRIPIMECAKLIRPEKSIDSRDLRELYLIHVKNELGKNKHQIILKKLQETAKKRKEEILSHLCKTGDKTTFVKLFDLQIEEAYLTGANNFLYKEIPAKNVVAGNELLTVNLKIKQAKEEISYKIDCIQNLVANIYNVLSEIRINSQETSLCVQRLGPYIYDLAWAHMMTQELNSKEIVTFKKFPVEYNRKFRNGHYYRNICDSTIPSYVELDSNNLNIITLLMDTPFCFVEKRILRTLQTKITINVLRSLPQDEPYANEHKYAQQELAKQEEYVLSVIEQLSSIINSTSVRQVVAAPNKIKEVADLWLEMPFRYFISEKKAIDGHNLKYYEKELEELRHNCVSHCQD